MKRWIYATTVLDSRDGFYYVGGRKGYFYESNARNINDSIARVFINAVCDYKGADDSVRQQALADSNVLKTFKRKITRASLEKKDTGKIVYYTISGAGFTENFPEEDFRRDIIVVK